MALAKRVTACFLVLFAACEARAGYCPPESSLSDGMRDIMLVYAETNRWGQANFLPYVAYLDREGQPQDWFYDAYLFLMYGGAPSGQLYIDGATDQRDWAFYLGELFAPNRELAALDAAVDEAARRLKRPAPTVPVIAMIPYPSARQHAFGDADGDGVPEDLGRAADREKAVAWYLREFLDRWQTQEFKHLKLWGFYWMNEGISPPDEAIVKSAARQVHALGYKFHWIPWFDAPGVAQWRELGFDLTIMQPNYAFVPPEGRLRVPDENRLSVAANLCRRLGMGIEMELNLPLDMEAAREMPVDLRDRVNLRLYLEHGDDALDGYQRGAVRAYYQGYNEIAGLCFSRDPGLRRLYDALYRFHKGTYKRSPSYQPARLSECCLSDGRWKTRPEKKVKAVELSGPSAALTLALERAHLVGDIRVHIAGATAPQRVTLAANACAEGGAFEDVASEDRVALEPETGGGFVALTFPARRVRQLRLEVEAKAGERMAVDEVMLMPVHHLLCGKPYAVGLNGSDPEHCLADGITGGENGAVWPNGKGEVRFALPEAWYAESLNVHFCGRAKSAFAPMASVESVAGVWTADPEGWAVVPLNRPIQNVTLRLESAGDVAIDEVALLPAKNLAEGCAYTYDPPFRAKYPDSDGRELTDGEVSQGFEDGKSVGWGAWSAAGDVTVLIDCGATQAIDSVELALQGGGHASVEFPKRVEAAVSEDGERWARFSTTNAVPAKTASREVDGQCCAVGCLSLPTPGARGRYVRVRIAPKGWLMLSECRAWSGGVNVAFKRPYSVHPQPLGEETYADNAGLLTDGIYTPAGSGWKTCAGFDKADPAVTVDLGRVRRAGAARLHLQGGGPGGVWFPQSVAVETSVDGQTWASAGATAEHPSESGVAAAAFMGVTFEARDARFVRFRVQRRGWAMLDEVEVLPGTN